MRKIEFLIAGDKSQDYVANDRVFLTSDNRYNKPISFRNDVSTHLTMHSTYFKKHFKYCRSSKIYRTELSWKDLRDKIVVERFTSNGHKVIYDGVCENA